MDDLIVIILTLIIAGAGAIGQMKKKKQAQTPVDAQKDPESIWDLFNQEVFPQAQQAEPEYYIDEEQPESVPYENEQGYQFDSKNEGGVIINKQEKTQPATKDRIKGKTEGFSLRKAVIYSEILNRKYI
jgi:hypothetical protein